MSETFVAGNHVEWFTNCQHLLEKQLQAIAEARSTVWLEMYWFGSDRVGRWFLDALRNAAERGVDVRVLYDSLGSFGSARHWFDALTAAGAQVIEFNPLSPFQVRFGLQRLTARDHRKLLIVDGTRAFLGGINLAEHWLPEASGGLGWKDEGVEVQGPSVNALCVEFEDSWLAAGGAPATGRPSSTDIVGTMAVAVLAQGGGLRRRAVSRTYLARVRAARHSVLISNAYFLPNRSLRRALRGAAERGVDVRIMLPGKSDVPLIRLASRGIWAPLLASGVRIYEWQSTILHSKIAVIDGQWVTVGSMNLDYISLRSNRELNLSILDAGLASEVSALFAKDLEHCVQVDAAAHQRRPLWLRGLERMLYWARAWL